MRLRTFDINVNPMRQNKDFYMKSSVSIKEGLTVLVGCNGSGKTNFMTQIENRLYFNDIPVIKYDNIRVGTYAKEWAMQRDDRVYMNIAATSSEGENIVLNISYLSKDIEYFITHNGEIRDDAFRVVNIFRKPDINKEEKPEADEFWVLIDSIDSGLSIDNIIDLKKFLFDKIIKRVRDKGKKIYIIVSANSYEMCRGEQCFDVRNGEYITFSDYEEFRDFIILSKQNKTDREFNS